MISIFDDASMEAADFQRLDPQVRDLLLDRIGRLPPDLLALSHFVCIEHGDTEADLVNEVAFSPLVNPLDGSRFGSSAAFEPWWDWLQLHPGAFELIVTVGNSGFAFVILIPDDESTFPALHSLCCAYADQRG